MKSIRKSIVAKINDIVATSRTAPSLPGHRTYVHFGLFGLVFFAAYAIMLQGPDPVSNFITSITVEG